MTVRRRPERVRSADRRAVRRRPALAVAVAATLAFLVGLLGPVPASAAAAPTSVTYSGPFSFETRRPAPLSAVLTSAGAPVVGRTVSFVYGAPDGANLPCSAITDASGRAACTIPRVPGGSTPDVNILVTFAGDSTYGRNSVFVGANEYAYINEGAFVVGDAGVTPINAAIGHGVTFFSPNWRDANALTSGPQAGAFHGFQTSDSEPKCGGAWKVYQENFDGPIPDSLPDHIMVAVTSKVKTSVVTDAAGHQRTNVQGNIAHVVIVAPDTVFPLNPSQGLTGKVITVLC